MDASEAADQSNVKVKPEAQPLEIVVRDQSGNEVQFKIKTTTKFEKVSLGIVSWVFLKILSLSDRAQSTILLHDSASCLEVSIAHV